MKPVFSEHLAPEFHLGRKGYFAGNYLDQSLESEDKVLRESKQEQHV